jgi:hypothetical protein
VKLARLYMKRVSTELENVGSINEPVREFLLLQGVRFAFRVHQVLLFLASLARYSPTLSTFLRHSAHCNNPIYIERLMTP